MMTFIRQFAKTRTDKFWIDENSQSVTLSRPPRPASVEAWLNGERMTSIAIADIVDSAVSLGPLRPGDTIIVSYQPKDDS